MNIMENQIGGSKLSTDYIPRRRFNPKSREDVEEYKHFLKTGKWKKMCPFRLDWPYQNIPDMLRDQYARSMLL